MNKLTQLVMAEYDRKLEEVNPRLAKDFLRERFSALAESILTVLENRLREGKCH